MRIQVTISDSMGLRLKEYCDFFGMSLSSFCALYIGKGVLELDQLSIPCSSGSFDSIPNELFDNKKID